jgi:ribonuclease HI
MNADYLIFVDGGYKEGLGLAVGAVVVSSGNGQVIVEQAIMAGEGTSNVAEYRALVHGICLANLVGARRPLFCSDSKLVVQQVNGSWAMTGDTQSDRHRAHAHCSHELMKFDRWVLKHVPRERNKRADWLVCSLLGHNRTTKKAPAVAVVDSEGAGRPGWSQL